MARTATTKPNPKAGTAVQSWDEQLALQAEVAAGMEANSGGGQFFSTQGGILRFNDSPFPGNQMAVVIADTILENVFYPGAYDPDNPSPPACFAFGRQEEGMKPHQTVFKAKQEEHPTCHGCPQAEWGSAPVGRGKACRNTRRLALIPAGSFDKDGRFTAEDDADHFEQAALAYLKLPVTSIKGYAGFVKQLAGVMRRPPHGVFTRIWLEADPKTQFKVLFAPLAPVPNNLMGAVMKRHEEAKTLIEFPYNLEREEQVPKGRGAKPVARRKY
jgi:hypothetical protein